MRNMAGKFTFSIIEYIKINFKSYKIEHPDRLQLTQSILYPKINQMALEYHSTHRQYN